jgi:hypothetical protein
VVLFHSSLEDDSDRAVGENHDDLKAISVSYSFANGSKGTASLPYKFEKDKLSYTGVKEFSANENRILFNTEVKAGKEYFAEREEIKQPVSENAIGLKIKKSNTQSLSNTWCGIFGFERFRRPNGGQIVREYFAMAMESKPVYTSGPLSVFEHHLAGLTFRAVCMNDYGISILPAVKTDYVLDISTREIDEWENVECTEAIVAAKARDTFCVWFYATDYAKNRNRYLAEKNLNIQISGIAFVLDIYKNEPSKSELKFSDDFTSYMPNGDLTNYGCFDFIGQLEYIREVDMAEATL